MMEEILIENIIGILLTLILTVQVSAFGFLWRQLNKTRQEASKNTETLTMLLNRIFGLEEDPTDQGHIVETTKKFEELSEKLEEISNRQKEACVERKKEHERVHSQITSIVRLLSKETDIDVDEKELIEGE